MILPSATERKGAGESGKSPDLFSWRAQLAAAALERRREEIKQELDRTLPRSHRRVVLEERLRALTLEALELERDR